MASSLKTQVLIIGAGPTGLMAANQLMRFGIDFVIIDSKSGPTIESRAITVTARSLELYEQLGLTDKVLEQGTRINSVNLFQNGKAKATVTIGEIGKGLTDFSYMLAFEQSKNETILTENLYNNGKKVHWEYEFVELTEYKDSICAIANHKGETVKIEAQYLIAADGARSPIRHQLEFSFKGGTYEDKFFVADTELDWNLAYDKLIIAPDKSRFCAFFPLKGDNTYRVIGTVPPEFTDKEDLEFADISELVKETSKIPMTFTKVNWFATYKLHHRGVDHFTQNRVFLAGDSAHIHSPAGGQGMNTGLQDSYNLAWKLAMVLKGQASDKLLDTYNEERIPFAKWLLKFTDRGFNVMTSRNWFVLFFRKYIAFSLIGLFLKWSKIRKLAFKTFSQIGWTYKDSSLSFSTSSQSLKFRAGDRFPYFVDGNIYSKLTNAGFHLVHVSSKTMEDANHIHSKFKLDLFVVHEKLDQKWRKLGVKKDLYILVRPDNYIGGIFDDLDQNEVNHGLKKYGIDS